MRTQVFKLILSVLLTFSSCFLYAQVIQYEKNRIIQYERDKAEALAKGKKISDQKEEEFHSKIVALKLTGLKSNEIRFYDHLELTLTSKAHGRLMAFESKIEKGDDDYENLLVQLGKEIAEILILSSPPKTNVVDKRKIDKLTYPSIGFDTLRIENNFGNLEVNAWDRNEILVHVESNAYGSNEENTMDIINRMGATETKKNNKIGLRTNDVSFNNTQRGSGVQTNYTIWVPSTIAMELRNKYGLIKLNNHTGPVLIVGHYVRISAGNFDNADNRVIINYSKAQFNRLNSKEFTANYSDVKINTVGKVNGVFKYTPAFIGSITGDTKLDLNLISDFTIHHIGKNVKNLTINLRYSSLAIGHQNLVSNFNFNVSGTRLDFKYNKAHGRITGGDYKNGYQNSNVYVGRYGNVSSTQLLVKSTGSFISLK